MYAIKTCMFTAPQQREEISRFRARAAILHATIRESTAGLLRSGTRCSHRTFTANQHSPPNSPQLTTQQTKCLLEQHKKATCATLL